jgi:hypothetical protein
MSLAPESAEAVPEVVEIVAEIPSAPTFVKLQTVGFDARFPNQNQASFPMNFCLSIHSHLKRTRPLCFGHTPEIAGSKANFL